MRSYGSLTREIRETAGKEAEVTIAAPSTGDCALLISDVTLAELPSRKAAFLTCIGAEARGVEDALTECSTPFGINVRNSIQELARFFEIPPQCSTPFGINVRNSPHQLVNLLYTR